MDTGSASSVKFFGNTVHDAGAANATALYHGVYFGTDSNHVEAGWNTVSNVHGCRGIQIHSSVDAAGTGLNQYDIIIHDNVIHDTQCDGIVLATVDPSKGPVQVFNNIIYNAGQGPNNPEQTGDWSCVYVAGITNAGTPGGGTVEVFNNTFYNCGSFASPPYSGANAGVNNGGNNPALKVQIVNNIIVQANAAAPYWVNQSSAPDGVFGSNNLVFGIGAAPGGTQVTGTLNGDPMFVAAASFDFHLQAGSPAIDTGSTMSSGWDFDGVSRPQGSGPDIGVFER
jgi:hypothetical protein